MTRTPDLTLAQVAEELSVPLKTAQELRRKRAFPNAYSVGAGVGPRARKIWRVPAIDVDNFKRARRAA